MARQKIADYFAQIGIKVDQKSIDRLGKSLDNIERGLHNMEAGAKKSAKQASSLVTQNKNLNKAISDGNKVLNKRAAVVDKIQRVNNKAIRASQQAMYDKLLGQTVQGKMKSQASGLGSAYTVKRGFGRLAQVEAQAKLVADSKLSRTMSDLAARAKESGIMDKLHASAIKEDSRRMKALKEFERVQGNVLRREGIMAERTSTIRINGAAKAAAIITAAELKAQAIASRMGGGGAGRPSGRGMFGGATVGGAVGAASSSMSGLLPGFGAAYAAVNFNKIGQELKSVENALLAVSGSEQAAAENMAFLNSVGAEMGKTVRGLGPEFVKLAASIQGTALGGQEQTIFKSFMKYGTVMGLDEEAMKGSFRAVSQMVSKQQVYAEELRGQLT